MVPPASSEYRCLPSFTSHNIVVPSLPPDAHREPSGEIATVYTTPVWPARLVRSLQSLRFQTLTSLPQPAETMSGVFADGENATLLTQSVCTSLSRPAETMSGVFAHGENATLLTQSVCTSLS